MSVQSNPRTVKEVTFQGISDPFRTFGYSLSLIPFFDSKPLTLYKKNDARCNGQRTTTLFVSLEQEDIAFDWLQVVSVVVKF